ncbi:hypothetical protein, partial [Brevibacillus formosus]
QMGSFKTSFMSVVAHQLCFQGGGIDLFSNYELKGSKPFRSYTDFLEVARSESSVICLDESHTTLSSRGFSNKGQTLFTDLLLYLRKMRTTLFCTSVRMEFIDSRVREICDTYIYATNNRGYVTYEIFDFQQKRHIKTVQISEKRFLEVLKALELFKTWRPVRRAELPDDKNFDIFMDTLIVENEKHYMQVV